MGTRVYIGRLPYDVRERDLEKFFKGYGRIREILLKNGFGFVEFDDYRDADDAVYELNGKELLGERYGPPTRTEYRLIVENLSSRVSWQDLKDYMRQAGEVTYADAHKTHRNEGVVEFATYTDMKNAIDKLSDTELNGRRIKLVEDKSNKRRRSRSRSDSRSRSRSRSPRSRSPRSRSRSRSRSPRSRSKSKSSSRSRSPRSRSKSPAKSKRSSKSKSKSISRSRSRDRGARSKSRSVSPRDRKSKSVEKNNKSVSRSRSPEKVSVKEEPQRSPDKDAVMKDD